MSLLRASAADSPAIEERAHRFIETALAQDVERFEPLAGGGGNRRYWRVRLADGSDRVLMQLLPEDRAILPPVLRAEGPVPLDQSPFVVVTHYLARHQVPVPALYALAPDEAFVLLEDLGSRHLLDIAPRARAPWYARAIELLARVHGLPREDVLPFRRAFDAEWVGFELELFVALVQDPDTRRRLVAAFELLAEAIAALPRALSLRDYQSQNLMIDPSDRLRVIDYQDALLAPRELDLAALLHDSYVELTPEERASLLAQYAAATGHDDPAAFALLTVQRKCKDLSRYRRLVEEKHDDRYAICVRRAADSIRSALGALPRSHSALAETLPAALEECAP